MLLSIRVVSVYFLIGLHCMVECLWLVCTVKCEGVSGEMFVLLPVVGVRVVGMGSRIWGFTLIRVWFDGLIHVRTKVVLCVCV